MVISRTIRYEDIENRAININSIQENSLYYVNNNVDNTFLDRGKAIINSINEYIDFSIKTSYSPESISKINWRSKEGQEFISAKCKQCYNILMSMGEE